MKLRLFGLILLVQLLCTPLMAEEEAVEEADGVRYIELTPAFVTNYGGPGPLKYIKTEVSLRVDSQEAYRLVRHHMPSLRYALIKVLTQQTEETVSSMEGKEQIRMQALADLQAVMKAEEDNASIEDVLFSSFFLQR